MTRRNEEHEVDEQPWDADDRSQYFLFSVLLFKKNQCAVLF
jgi:hypothetical protein